MEILYKKVTELSNLKAGQIAKIVKISNSNKKVRRYLLDRGFTKGIKVEVIKKYPLKDMKSISLRGYNLDICSKYLDEVEVELIG